MIYILASSQNPSSKMEKGLYMDIKWSYKRYTPPSPLGEGWGEAK